MGSIPEMVKLAVAAPPLAGMTCISTLRKPASSENVCLNVYQPEAGMHRPPGPFGFAPIRSTFVVPMTMKPVQLSPASPVLTLNPKSRRWAPLVLLMADE